MAWPGNFQIPTPRAYSACQGRISWTPLSSHQGCHHCHDCVIDNSISNIIIYIHSHPCWPWIPCSTLWTSWALEVNGRLGDIHVVIFVVEVVVSLKLYNMPFVPHRPVKKLNFFLSLLYIILDSLNIISKWHSLFTKWWVFRWAAKNTPFSEYIN